MSKGWSSGIQHHPIRKQFQCKHISTELMVLAVLLAPGAIGNQASSWRMRWDVEKELRKILGEGAPEGLAKIMMAKFAKLKRQGILDGCECGCRGDYHIPLTKGGCC